MKDIEFIIDDDKNRPANLFALVDDEQSNALKVREIKSREKIDGCDVVEFELLDTDGRWSEVYQEYLAYGKRENRFKRTPKDYHDWLSENFYAPVRK